MRGEGPPNFVIEMKQEILMTKDTQQVEGGRLPNPPPSPEKCARRGFWDMGFVACDLKEKKLTL